MYTACHSHNFFHKVFNNIIIIISRLNINFERPIIISYMIVDLTLIFMNSKRSVMDIGGAMAISSVFINILSKSWFASSQLSQETVQEQLLAGQLLLLQLRNVLIILTHDTRL